MYKKILAGAFFLAVAIIAIAQGLNGPKPVQAMGPMITNFNNASSSGVLVTTSNTLVSATNTARVYMEISNLGSSAVFCAMKGGDRNQTAALYSGWTIFASSTKYIKSDENPYIGPVYCISTATMQLSIIEK